MMTIRTLRAISAYAFALVLSCALPPITFAADAPPGKGAANASAPSAADQKAAADKAAAAKAAADKAAADKVAADKAAAEKAAADKAALKCPATGDIAKVRVKDAFLKEKDRKAGKDANTAPKPVPGTGSHDVRLGDEIYVRIDGLKVLWDHAACMTPPKKVLLFLEGRPITNVFPEPPTDPSQETLIFPLRRDDKSRDAWTAILGRPTLESRRIDVSVGVEGLHPVPSATTLDLEVISIPWLAFWIAIVVAASWRVVVKRHTLLRTPGSLPAAERPYSLARVQMMWWFFISIASYLFIGLITGDYSSTITGTVLVLTGISAGTTLLSGSIDQRPPAPPPAGVVVPPPVSVGLWQDIVSDALGPNVHRYQMVVWTVVLGIVFIWSVYQVLAMPQFNETLLTLMGISSGTYVGLKNIEVR